MRPRSEERPACPNCGARQAIPILYGLPSPAMQEAADRGEIVLGGCVIAPEFPIWLCPVCEHRWGRLIDREKHWEM